MAKSLELTACMPSMPAMPTPTCASWIMGTSLAPSPMERARHWGSCAVTMCTMARFWSGETRQATTDLQICDGVVGGVRVG